MQPGRTSLLTSCSFTDVSAPLQLKIFKGKFLLQGLQPLASQLAAAFWSECTLPTCIMQRPGERRGLSSAGRHSGTGEHEGSTLSTYSLYRGHNIRCFF